MSLSQIFKGDILRRKITITLIIIPLSLSSLLIADSALELNLLMSKTGNELSRFIQKSRDSNITPRDRNPNINMLRGEKSKGQKIFQKYFQKPCQMSAQIFASKHSQDEWEDIKESGIFQEYVVKICPNIKNIYKKEWSDDLYQFVYTYAYDSGKLLNS